MAMLKTKMRGGMRSANAGRPPLADAHSGPVITGDNFYRFGRGVALRENTGSLRSLAARCGFRGDLRSLTLTPVLSPVMSDDVINLD